MRSPDELVKQRRPCLGLNSRGEGVRCFFCEHAQLEQVRQAGSFPKPATASHAPLQLFAEGFDGATAQRSSFVFSAFTVEVVPMGSEVFHFSGDGLAGFGGTLGMGLGFEKLLKPVDREGFIAVARRLELLGQPILGPLSSDPAEGFGDGSDMLPGVVKILVEIE